MRLCRRFTAWRRLEVRAQDWLRLTSELESRDDEDVPCHGTDADAWWPETKNALKSSSTAFSIDGLDNSCPGGIDADPSSPARLVPDHRQDASAR